MQKVRNILERVKSIALTTRKQQRNKSRLWTKTRKGLNGIHCDGSSSRDGSNIKIFYIRLHVVRALLFIFIQGSSQRTKAWRDSFPDCIINLYAIVSFPTSNWFSYLLLRRTKGWDMRFLSATRGFSTILVDC